MIDIIPDAAYDNPTWKGLAYFGRDLVVYGLVVWGLIVVTNPLRDPRPGGRWPPWPSRPCSSWPTTAPTAPCSRRKRLNSIVGHIAMLPSWHVYEAWILGHNRIHHAYTVRQGYDFVWQPYTAEEYAAMGPLGRLRHRFEWSWAGAGVVLHPRGVAHEDDGRSTRRRGGRRPSAGTGPSSTPTSPRSPRILGVVGWSRTGTVLGTAWLIVRVMVIPFLAFSYLIGSVVHVHHVQPDIRWWKRREWTKFKGQMEGTTILRTAPGMNFFLHWIMVHIPHHVDMRIPMYNLELAADAIKAGVPGDRPRRAHALPGLHRQQPPVQALRLRRRHLADLRRGAAAARGRPSPPLPLRAAGSAGCR